MQSSLHYEPVENSSPVRLPKSYQMVTTLHFTDSKTSWKYTSFDGFLENHGEDDEECSISAVPRETKIHLSLLRWTQTTWSQCKALPQLVQLSKQFSPGILSWQHCGEWAQDPWSFAVTFSLACSPASAASCLPLHRAAGLPKGGRPAQGSCNPPDPSRRASSATAHLFPNHVLWRLGQQLPPQLHLVKEEECDLVAVLPVSFRGALSLSARSGLPQRQWPGATLACLVHRVGKQVLSTHWPRGHRFAEARVHFSGGSVVQNGDT